MGPMCLLKARSTVQAGGRPCFCSGAEMLSPTPAQEAGLSFWEGWVYFWLNRLELRKALFRDRA